VSVLGQRKAATIRFTANTGLPFVRTSVDRGTVFDIAGKGVASHSSMLESIRLAVALAKGDGLADF